MKGEGIMTSDSELTPAQIALASKEVAAWPDWKRSEDIKAELRKIVQAPVLLKRMQTEAQVRLRELQTRMQTVELFYSSARAAVLSMKDDGRVLRKEGLRLEAALKEYETVLDRTSHEEGAPQAPDSSDSDFRAPPLDLHTRTLSIRDDLLRAQRGTSLAELDRAGTGKLYGLVEALAVIVAELCQTIATAPNNED
jgi:hypothetical protein